MCVCVCVCVFALFLLSLSLISLALLDVSQTRKATGQLTSDRRNMHLANIGRIDNNSGALWNELSAKDKSKRMSAIANKTQMLQNPNYAVSAVRLSVRNLPKSVDEHKLRHMFSSGSKSVLRQVKIVKVIDVFVVLCCCCCCCFNIFLSCTRMTMLNQKDLDL
jgi:hypothetical protein